MAKSDRAKLGSKSFARKQTINPTLRGGQPPESQTGGGEEQDPKRRIGQYGDTGEPPLMKK